MCAELQYAVCMNNKLQQNGAGQKGAGQIEWHFVVVCNWIRRIAAPYTCT